MSSASAVREQMGVSARIVFVSGNFNVLHPGHARFLRFARELGDCLVVGVNPETSPGARGGIEERLEGVRGNRFVDHAFAITPSLDQVLRDLQPNVVVKGREHEGGDNPERAILAEHGGTLIFASGEALRSSNSSLSNSRSPDRLAHLPHGYLKRHGIVPDQLLETVERFADLRVLVIGDLIVDEYIDCDPLGMSQEDPTLVVSPRDHRKFVGGAGIVASHGSGLGAKVTYLSVAGNDGTCEEAENWLCDYGVQCHIVRDISRPTTLKQRFRAAGKTLLRVSHLRQHAVSLDLAAQLYANVEKRIDQTDLILFSDFNYGCLPSTLVTKISNLARQRGVACCADSQVSSQMGDISRFHGMELITPTELEARLALNEQEQNLVVVSQLLMERAKASNVIMTLGADGVLIRGMSVDELDTDRIRALNPSPVDVAGGGDSLFCTASLALSCGADIWQAGLLGSIAAAVQVGRLGNTPLLSRDLIDAIQSGVL